MLDDLLNKYTKPQKRGVNSPAGEQLELIVNLTGKPWKQIAGLTKHLSVDQLHRLYKESNNSPQLWWYNYKTKYKQNNMEKLVLEKLRTVPQFRERKTRGIFLTKLSLRENGIEQKWKNGETLTLEELAKFATTYETLERCWRKCTLEDPSLQGIDYAEKYPLVDKTLKSLGYK